MKKIGRLFLTVFIGLFSSALVANAASKCDYNEQAELNNTVANIKVSYEEAEAELEGVGGTPIDTGEEATYYYFKVQIYNVSEKVYFKIENDVNKEVQYKYYKDSQSGVIEFDWKDLNRVANFTITVYSSNKTNCPNEEYRIINLTLPRFNDFSNNVGCIGNESLSICQKYITDSEVVDYETFLQKLESFEQQEAEEQKKNEELNSNKFVDFIQNNKLLVGIISTVIVAGGVVTIVIVIRKRRSRLI